MLLRISVNRLFNSRSSLRRRNHPTATAQIERTEPRRCLSATAIADPVFDEAIEDEFVEFDTVGLDAWSYAYEWGYVYDDFSYDWSADFNDIDYVDFGTDWSETDSWYAYDTWTDIGWSDTGWYEYDLVSSDWSDASFGWDNDWLWSEDYAWTGDDDFWSFDNDTLIPTGDFAQFDEFAFDVYETFEYESVDVFADAHLMDEGIVFNVGDGFTCELLFLDDVAVVEVLLADDLSFEDNTAFDIDLFDDGFGSGEVFIEQVVFEDEFAFFDVPGFEDETIFDGSFGDDFAADSFDIGLDGFAGELDLGSFAVADTMADAGLTDFGSTNDVSGDFIIEFDDGVGEIFVEGFSSITDFTDVLSGDLGAEPGLSNELSGSETPDGFFQSDSEVIDGKTVTLDSSIADTVSLIESIEDTGGLNDFTTTGDAKGVGGDDLFALSGFDFSQVSLVGLGSSETGDLTTDAPESRLNGPTDLPTAALETSTNGPGRQAFEAKQGTVDNPTRGETRIGSLATLARRQRGSDAQDRDQPTRRSVNGELVHRLHSHAPRRHTSGEVHNPEQGADRSERAIPVVSQSPQRSPQLLTQQSSDAASAQQRSARSRFDFRMSRAAAQESRLTTQPRSESQNVSYDATLLAFEHPALSMQLDGLSMPTDALNRNGTSENLEGQPGYAQMASAAGTIAISGAAGLQFTQRRGWSMLLRFARTLLGRI